MIGSVLPLIVASPFIGSFLGVLIHRLPLKRSVALPRSKCESCRRTLAAQELLPVISYVVLRGRCRTCRAPIPRYHLYIELAATFVAIWAILAEADPARVWIACALGWSLLTLAWIDWDHMLLPDVLTLPLVVLGLVVTAFLAPTEVADHAAAAMLGYVAVRGLGASYRWLRGREGIGQGDAKLLAAAGAWVGLEALPWALLFGALFGMAVLVAREGRSRGLQITSAVPFGPGFCLALWLVWLYR
jgi:leader peptidase (prepilin peptidase)/N-methyltransferase